MVWNTQNSKSLLSHPDARFCPRMSFSSNGLFFACATIELDIYLWKESPSGYTLHGIFVSSAVYPNPLLSPNGESIIAFGGCTIQLWHTKNLTTTPSTISTWPPQHNEYFVLDFSPNGALAAVVRESENLVTVIELKSGTPQLIIDTNMEVYGLRVTGNTIVVLGKWKVITWNLPVGDCVPDARASIKDSTQTINLSSQPQGHVGIGLISPNAQHVAFAIHSLLYIYSASTGECLGHYKTDRNMPWFTPDSHSVWWVSSSGEADLEVWTITEDGTRLVFGGPAVDPEHPPGGYPWVSSCGYQTTNDGWVLGPDGKRLLMLPPPWKSQGKCQVWNGPFLALLYSTLPEPIILELDL